MLSVCDKAYLAGIIDGEGSIVVSKCPQRNYVNYNIKLIITTSDFCLVEWCIKKTNAKVYEAKPRGNISKKLCYRICFQNQDCINMLKQVIEYMVIKKERASFLINEYPLKFVRNKEKREYVYNRIRQFNSGISPIPIPIGEESERSKI